MKALRVRAVARRHVYVLQRNPQRWFDIAIWPAVDTILFGSIGVWASSSAGAGKSGTAHLLAGILLFHVVFQAEIGLATGFMEETWSRNLLNILVTPVTETEYVSGVVLFGLAKLAMGLLTVALVGVGLFAFNITTIGIGLVPIAAVLLLMGWALGLVVIGLILRFGQGAEILAWGLLAMMLPLSGAFYPVDSLPSILQPLAVVLPTTHAFSAARDLLDGKPFPWDELGLAAIGTVVCSILAVAFVRWMMAVFRNRGYITRYT